MSARTASRSDTTAGIQHYFELDPTSGTPLAVSYGSGAATHGYAYTDALGNLAGMIDAAGTVAAAYTYGPYGTLLTQTGTLYNPWRYKTGYTDTTTGLTKYGNRYYDPTTGRWTQQDSLTFLNNPAQGNRYAFAADDPVNLSDPSGRSPLSCGLATAAQLLTIGSLIVMLAAVPPVGLVVAALTFTAILVSSVSFIDFCQEYYDPEVVYV